MDAPALVIGLGQLLAGDDAAGILVAQHLGERLTGRVEVVVDEHRWWTLPGEDLTRRQVLLIDACEASDTLPVGKLRRFAYPADRGLLAAQAWRGSHSLDALTLLDLTAALGHLPQAVSVFAIGAAFFGTGTGPSPAVARALPEIVRVIAEQVTACGEVQPCTNSQWPAASSASPNAAPTSTESNG